MNEQLTKNCHYVSRLLTTPWEYGQRFLHYYDFDADDFGYLSSKSLFAEERINSPVVEDWLKRYIEDPLGQIRQRLADGDLTPLENQWSRYRAVLLMIWLQGVRAKSVNDLDARVRLETLATMPAHGVDQFTLAMKEDFDLRFVPTRFDGDSYAPLFMPSTGMFRVLLPDTGCLSGFSTALAVPIDVRAALLVSPAQKHGRIDASRLQGSISNWSVGANESRKVVVFPRHLEQLGKIELRRVILELRSWGQELLDKAESSRALVANAFATSGLEVPRDTAGRIPPFSKA